MARLDPNPYPLPEIDFGNWSPDQPHDAEFRKLMDASDALGPDELKGTVLSFPMGDGAAYYIVTKLKPFTVQWIPYSDAWSISAAHIRGLQLDDVREHARHRAAMKALFGKSREATRS